MASHSTTTSAAFDRGTDPIFSLISVEQARKWVEYRGTPELQDRIEVLAARCNDGSLSDEERAEYEGYVRANKFVALLQAKARKLIAQPGP